MERINISVPSELFQRMKAARAKGSRIGPNWSEVACEAFEAVLQKLKKVQPTMSTAVRLPYPTSGDYSLFEVRRARQRIKVKVSSSVCDAPHYVHRSKLPRIVATFAQEFLDEHPEVAVADGDVLPAIVTSNAADDIARRL